MEALWRIELLGGLRATQNDRVLTRLPRRKIGVLLAYLACFHQRTHPRDVLVDFLWPDADLEAGRRDLSVALTRLRDELEPPGVPSGAVLVADRFSVGLNPAAVTTDVAELETALKAAGVTGSSSERIRFLADAVEQYRGELLPGHLDEWILLERRRVEELFFQASHQLITCLAQAGDLDSAIQHGHRAVSVDPLREEVHQELIRLYLARGQPGAALRQYRELEEVLKREMDEAPGAATRALVQSLLSDGRPRALPPNGSTAPPAPPPISPDASPSLRPEALRPRSEALLVSPGTLEPPGGAVPLGSTFYVVRPTDQEFSDAIARQDSIVLVKGTRQVGKTSLLARGLDQARRAGARVVLTDFQMFNATHLESVDALLLALAHTLADRLELDVSPTDVWAAHRGPNPNLRRYLERQVLGTVPGRIVWGLDAIDRLFPCDFAPEVFGLFRAWHNERAFDPTGPWARLTLAIGYATEAQLFIRDADQSPFNVGTRLTLEDLTLKQVAELNRRYPSPLKDESEVARFYHLVGGHPYLVRRGLHEMSIHPTEIAAFEARAGTGDWIYGDHLRRLLVLLAPDSDLCEAVRMVLQGRPCPTLESFYRLRSAGILTGDSERDARPRCQLYATYLQRHLL